MKQFNKPAVFSLMGFALVSSLSFSMAAQASAVLEEMPVGLWQLNAKTELPNMPPETAAALKSTTTHCVKAEDSRKWSEQQKSANPGGQRCDMSNLKNTANKVSWNMKCSDGTTGDGLITHNGKDAYTMVNNIQSAAMGKVKVVVEGKKISDTCPAK